MIYVLTGIRVSKHILAHRFLNIQRIFNPKKVLESWDIGLFNGTFRFSLSSSWYRIVVVHVVVQTGNALSSQKLLDVTTRIDGAFPVWTTTWTTTIRYQLLDRLNLKVPLNSSGGSRIFQMGGRCFVANGGAHILFSGKKCMKLKEIGLKWGGARLLAPCYSKITIFLWIILNSIMKTSYFTYFENNLLKRPPGSLGAMVLLQNCSFDT